MSAPSRETDNDKYAELIERAEVLLAQRWAAPVRLSDVIKISEPRRRNLLLRCHVDGPADAPESVILKRARQRRYDPDDPKSRAAVGLFRDWAGLQFLGTIDDGRLACPHFYGGDREAGFFVMEDLGAGIELDEVLTRGCADDARRALLMLAEALGRMHALSAGHADEFQCIRDALGKNDGQQRLRLATHVRTYAPEFVERCEALGVTVSPAITADVEHVAEVMADPGPLLTYTHADACPDNCVLAGDRVRLFDYEFGNFRHALLDGVYGWIRFPTCWCARDIPPAIVNEMDSVYRRELVLGCPEAADDRVYFPAVADACAYWLLENMAHLFDRALLYAEPKGTSTNRQRILTRIAAFCEVAERADHLPGLRETLRRLQEVLQQNWADSMPLYDAFVQPTALQKEDVQAIVAAVSAFDVDRVGQLLDRVPGLANAKASDADQTPVLYLAMDTGNSELVKLLLKHGADWRITTRTGWTVLSRACSHGTTQIVDLLLEQGADLNTRDNWGTLPVYGAVTTGNALMLKHLLATGAKPDLKLAIDLKQLGVARQLLEQDSYRARTRFGTGLTLLHDSARVGDSRLEAMQLLLEFGARVNETTNWGATPLHLAAFHGNAGAVALLIDHGAALDAADKFGMTALEIAHAKHQTECAQLLQDQLTKATEAANAAAGFQSIIAGAGINDPTLTIATKKSASDAELAKLDAFYSMGDFFENEPHPLDEFAADLAIERLRQQDFGNDKPRNREGEAPSEP